MSHRILAPVVIATLVLTAACSSDHKDKKKASRADAQAYTMPVSQKGIDTVTANWPAKSKDAIKSLTGKYGLPSAVTDDMVVWNSSSPVKRSIVYREEVSHQFPMEHKDVLQQTVDYRVPHDKVAALSKFDGSLIVDRTKGELSARNEHEELNILSLNLADKVVRGEMTVEEARRQYLTEAQAFEAGTTGAMLSGLNFKSQGTTSDPDTTMQSQQFGSGAADGLESDLGTGMGVGSGSGSDASGDGTVKRRKTETVEEITEE
jgi:hypothetical protein